MKFYEVEVDGWTIGCELSLKAAKELVQSRNEQRLDWRITVLEVPVSVETVRRMLAKEGGYAQTLRYIDP